jgi:hypothetical protein
LGLAVYSEEDLTAHSALQYLAEQAGGDPTAVESIRSYNRETGSWETASWFMGEPAGVDFPIKPGEAYLIYMRRDVDDVWFEGVALGAAVDLTSGMNLVTLPAPGQGFTYDSHEMLQGIGDENEVASVRRYDFSDGWEATFWFEFGDSYQAAGELYDTSEKEGYLILMKQAKEQWRAY